MSDKSHTTAALANAPDKTTERAALCDYLLSEDYRRLLIKAVSSRLGTSAAHKDEHMHALDLLEAAFPGEVK